MKISLICLTAIVFAGICAIVSSPALADIAWTDDVLPYDPATWTSSMDTYIGKTGTGTLTVNGNSDVLSRSGNIAYEEGSSGAVTVSGNGSSWICGYYCNIGRSGSGTLDIKAGAVVEGYYGYIGTTAAGVGVLTVNGLNSAWRISHDTYVGRWGDGTLRVQAGATVECLSNFRIAPEADSMGLATVTGANSTLTCASLELGNSDASSSATLNINDEGEVIVTGAARVHGCDNSSMMINFDGGTLTTQTLYAPPAQLAGAGTINARGMMGDVNLVFDSAASLTQSFMFDSLPNQDIAVNLNMSNSADVGSLGVGFHGNGSVTIQNGVEFNSLSAHVAFDSGSTATATVTGANSKWITSSGGDFYVGDNGGDGTLNVTVGAAVSSNEGYVGNGSGSTGAATVSASTWNNSSNLYVGNEGGVGTLNVTNGATVTSARGYIGYAFGSTGATTGTVTISGLNSAWNCTSGNSFVSVGGYQGGTGTLNLENGGTLATKYTIVGYNSGSVGTLNLKSGGTLATNKIMASSGERNVNFDGGILKPYDASSDWITTGSGPDNIYIRHGGATFDTDGYDMKIGVPLQHGGVAAIDGGVTKIGAGMLTLTGANTYDGLTTVKAGTLILGPGAQSRVLAVRGADIQGGEVVFDYAGAGGTNPAAQIASILDTSYGDGSNPFTEANGAKIFSSTADATRGLGWIDDGDNLQVLVKYTLYGDATLDGTVNFDDLTKVLTNYNLAGIWELGDFTYDGMVDFDDLTKVLANYNTSIVSGTTVGGAGLDAQAIGLLSAAGFNVVPEPGTLAMLAAGLLGLLVYVWRQRK